MYTKKQLIDLIHLNVSGGRLSPDVDISRPNVAAMLPAFISEAITIYMRQERRERAQMMGVAPSFGNDVAGHFLSTYEINPVADDDRPGLYYAPLPGKVQIVPGNSGLGNVFSKNMRGSYIKVGSQDELIGIQLVDTTFYWYEKQSDGTARLYFYNMGSPVCTLYTRLIVSLDDLAEDDIIPMPDAFAKSIIENMLLAYNNILGRPTDQVANDSDGQE